MMNNPDFETWTKQIQNAASNPNLIAQYYTTISKMLVSISETGFLPDPYIHHTQNFLDTIVFNILIQILNRSPGNEFQFSIMRDFIVMFINFSIYGFQSLEKTPIKIAFFILNNDMFPLFNSPIAKSRFLDSEVANIYLHMNIISRLDNLLPNQIQNSEMLMYIIAVYSRLSYFIPNFDPSKFFYNSYQAISYTLSKDGDLYNISIALDYLRQTLTHALDCVNNNIDINCLHSFFELFLPILSQFLRTEHFDQRINVLNQIDNILNEKKYSKEIKETIAHFFLSEQNNNLSLLTNLKYHKAYKNAISNIFNALSIYSKKQLSIEIINSLWELHLNLSPSDSLSFFECFLHLADGDDEGYILTFLINCLLQDDNETKDSLIFFDQIDYIVSKVLVKKSYSVKPLLDMIREKLRKIAFNTNLDEIVIQKARQTLVNIITIDSDLDDFDELIDELNQTNDPFIYILLNEFLKDDVIQVPEDKLICLINQTMKNISEHDLPNISQLCDFLLSLATNSNSYFNIDQLLSLSQSIPNYFSFLLKLAKSNSIDPNDFETIINAIPIESFDLIFYEFIKFVIYKDNELKDANLNALPIKHEDILWSLATQTSTIQKPISRLLCKVYSLNDGFNLTDENMIKMFLSTWEGKFCQDSDNDYYLELLRQFITRIEMQTVRDPSIPLPHEYFENDIPVFVRIDQASLKIDMPRYAEIGMVTDQISILRTIPMNSFCLYCNDKKLRKSKKIVELIDRSIQMVSVNLELKFVQKKSKRDFHHRTAFPSMIIMNDPMIPLYDFFNKLENNNKSAYYLLQVLPQLPKSTDFNDDISIETVFNPLKPLLFFYNLQTLVKHKNLEKIIEKFGLIDYFYSIVQTLFDSMKELNDTDENGFYISINNSKMSNPNHRLIFILLVFLKKLTFIQDPKSLQQIYYLFIKCSFELMNYSRLHFDQAIESTKLFTKRINIAHIEFPDNDFIDIFNQFLMNQNCDIRIECVEVFDCLLIPLSVFISAIENYGCHITCEYLNVLSRHMSDYQNSEQKEIFTKTILSLLESSHGPFLKSVLSIILNQLQFNLFDNEQKMILLQYFIDHFLTFDYDKNDQIAFEQASHCMALLSNIKNDENELILKNCLKFHHENELYKDIEYSKYDIDGDSCSISPFNRVGLKNLKMTCYLNATLQQLFAMKPIRYAIMSYQGDDPFLIEFSKLFYTMKLFKGKVVSPASLIRLWKIGPNETLDPRVQQDAAEILQNLFLMFEKDKTLDNSINKFLQGDFVNRFDGIKEDFHAERDETFKTLELNVEGLNDLHQSLENFIKPEPFTGNSQYYADELGKKIDANRTIYIKTPPPLLIVHLMRFEYNFIKNQRTKLTNPFTITQTIDISPLCVHSKDQSIDQNDMTYILIGVIIHKGCADAGHYISFVYQKKKQIWLCFDDQNVSMISEADVLQEASGFRNNSTGYILFFERMMKDLETNEPYFITDRMEINKPENISKDTLTEIEIANKSTQKSRLMCSKGYFILMDRLSKNISLDYLDICLQYAVDTLPYCKYAGESGALYSCLSQKIAKSPFELKDFFIHLLLHGKCLQTSLFLTPHTFVRKGIANLICKCYENELLDPIPIVSEIFEFVECCLNYYTQIDSMFKVLFNLHNRFEKVKEFAHENELPQKVCSLFDIGLKNFLAGNPGLKTTYIFEGIVLTNYLKLLIDFQLVKRKVLVETENQDEYIDEDFVHYIFEMNGTQTPKYALYFDKYVSPVVSQQFLVYLCLSLSSVRSVSNYIDSYYSSTSFIICLQNNLSTFKPFRIISILFQVCQNDAMRYFFDLPLVNDDHRLSSAEQVAILIGLVYEFANNEPQTTEEDGMYHDDLVDQIVAWCEIWLPLYLYDDNVDTRQNCVVLCGYLAPCDIFPEAYLEIDYPDNLDLPSIALKAQYPINPTIRSILEKFLKVCFATAPILNEKIRNEFGKKETRQNPLDAYQLDDEISEQFIQLVAVLLTAVKPENNDYSPIVSLYSTLATSSYEMFNNQMRNLIDLMLKYSIDIDINILMLPFQDNTVLRKAQENDISFLNELARFLPSFLTLLQQIDTNYNSKRKFEILNSIPHESTKEIVNSSEGDSNQSNSNENNLNGSESNQNGSNDNSSSQSDSSDSISLEEIEQNGDDDEIHENDVVLNEDLMFPISDNFLNIYFKVFLFNSNLNQILLSINTFLHYLIDTRPSIRQKLSTYIRENCEDLCDTYYWEVIHILSYLNEQNEFVLDKMYQCLLNTAHSAIDINPWVQKVIQVSSKKKINNEQRNEIIQSCNLDEETIALLLSLDSE